MQEVNNLRLDIIANLKAEGFENVENYIRKLDDVIGQTTQKAQRDYSGVLNSPSYMQNKSGLDENQIKQAAQFEDTFRQSLAQMQDQLMGTHADTAERLGYYQYLGGKVQPPQVMSLRRGIISSYSNVFNRMNEWQSSAETLRNQHGPDSEMGGIMEAQIASIKNQKSAILDSIREELKIFDEMAQKFAKVKGEGTEFIKKLGQIFSIGYMISQAGQMAKWAMHGSVVESEIGGHYRTAFDYTSPIGSYSAGMEAQLFERMQRRSYAAQGWQTGAGIAQGAGMAFISSGNPYAMLAGGVLAVLGTIGGAYAGNQAQIANIEDQSRIQEQLKMTSQFYSMAKPAVDLALRIENLGMRTRRRTGANLSGGELRDLGLTMEEGLGVENSFSASRGYYDGDLMHEQATWAKAHGLEPGALFGVNRTSMITGESYGAAYQLQATKYAKAAGYADPNKAIEYLAKIADTQVQMLQLSVKADLKDTMTLFSMPSKLFGPDSPYGKMDVMGGRTMNTLANLMQPGDRASEAWLYSSLGLSPKEFNEMKKGGMMNNLDSFQKAMRTLQRIGAGMEPNQFYFMLDHLFKDGPQGMVPHIQELLTKGSVSWTDKEGKSQSTSLSKLFSPDTGVSKAEQDKFTKDMQTDAQNSVTKLNRLNFTMEDINKKIGDTSSKTIIGMMVEQARFSEKLFGQDGVMEQLNKASRWGQIEQYSSAVKNGIIGFGKVEGILSKMYKDPDELLNALYHVAENNDQESILKENARNYVAGKKRIQHEIGVRKVINEAKSHGDAGGDSYNGVIEVLHSIHSRLGDLANAPNINHLHINGSNPNEVWELANSSTGGLG